MRTRTRGRSGPQPRARAPTAPNVIGELLRTWRSAIAVATGIVRHNCRGRDRRQQPSVDQHRARRETGRRSVRPRASASARVGRERIERRRTRVTLFVRKLGVRPRCGRHDKAKITPSAATGACARKIARQIEDLGEDAAGGGSHRRCRSRPRPTSPFKRGVALGRAVLASIGSDAAQKETRRQRPEGSGGAPAPLMAVRRLHNRSTPARTTTSPAIERPRRSQVGEQTG